MSEPTNTAGMSAERIEDYRNSSWRSEFGLELCDEIDRLRAALAEKTAECERLRDGARSVRERCAQFVERYQKIESPDLVASRIRYEVELPIPTESVPEPKTKSKLFNHDGDESGKWCAICGLAWFLWRLSPNCAGRRFVETPSVPEPSPGLPYMLLDCTCHTDPLGRCVIPEHASASSQDGPSPAPGDARQSDCGVCGGSGSKEPCATRDGHGTNDGNPRRFRPAPSTGEFSLRERLSWLDNYLKDGFSSGMITEIRRGDGSGSIHEAIDDAMRAAGLKPVERERITWKEICRVYLKAYGEAPTGAARSEVGIRAVLDVATDSQGNRKIIED